MLSCSSRLGHLLTALTSSAAELRAVHHAALGRRTSRILVLGDADDFLGQRNDVFAAPDHGQRPSAPSNAGASARAFGGPAGQAVLDHQQVDVLLAQLLAAARRSCRSSDRSRRPTAHRSTPSSRLRRSLVIRSLTNLLMVISCQLSGCQVSVRRAGLIPTANADSFTLNCQSHARAHRGADVSALDVRALHRRAASGAMTWSMNA